jgi:hypothetical protein
MATTWTIAIDWSRKGNFDGTDDNVTNRVISANWFIGMRKPYQDIADDSMLELVLDNSDKRFSPENGGSPLAGYLVPFRPVRVQSNDGTTTRTHYFGWIESIEPQPNQYGERQVKITCAGPMQFFKAVETSVAIQENKRTDEIIEVLLDEVPMPPRLVVSAIVGDTTNPVGTATVPDVKIARDLQEGKTVLAIAADNWVRQSPDNDDSRPQTFNVYHAIKDVAGAERGRFFFNREGQAIFWNRHQLFKDNTVQATFDNSMTEMEYTFAGLEEFTNDIRVTCHPRQIGPGGELLWQYAVEDKDAIRLRRNREHEVKFSYKSESGKRIAARDVQVADVTYGPYEYAPTGGTEKTTQVILEAKANGGTIKFRAGNIPITKISGIEVRGQTITDYGQMEATAQDQLSITRYGRHTLRLNLPAVDNIQAAQSIADFERYRRKEPLGKVSSMTLLSQGKQGGDAHADQLAREIGDRIEVVEAQLGHTGEYFIIGEAQKLSENATLLETTWYLESAIEGNWAVVGDAKVYGDGTEDPEPYMPYIGYIVAY